MELVPAIDIIDGRCVRLSKGDYNACKVYSDKPLEIAKQFEDLGFRRLHVVDLDGARSAHVINYSVLEKITSQTNLVVDFGGGIKSDTDLQIVWNSGAAYATIGSIAVTSSSTVKNWINQYGSERFILGADCLHEQIRINGWIDSTKTDVFTFINDYGRMGIHNVLCTDIAKDGMLKGPSIGLYEKILLKCPGCSLIASGGVRTLEDIEQLDSIGVKYVVFGKAIYEGTIDLGELVNNFG